MLLLPHSYSSFISQSNPCVKNIMCCQHNVIKPQLKCTPARQKLITQSMGKVSFRKFKWLRLLNNYSLVGSGILYILLTLKAIPSCYTIVIPLQSCMCVNEPKLPAGYFSIRPITIIFHFIFPLRLYSTQTSLSLLACVSFIYLLFIFAF